MKKSSSSQSIDLLQFLNPFDTYVWIATLASLVLISIAVFLINYFSPYGYKDDNGQGTSGEFSFFNSVWFSLACMLQQGADNSPRSLSGMEPFIRASKFRKSVFNSGKWQWKNEEFQGW